LRTRYGKSSEIMEEKLADNNSGREGTQEASLRFSFWIHDPSRLWLVEAGSVDMFLVMTEDGEPAGARHHIMRVEKGGAIFGVAPPASTAMRILAAATPESRLAEQPLSRMREMLQAPGEKERAAGLLEGWITGFSRAAAGKVLPKTFESLEPGSTLALKEAGSVVSRAGVVWVEALQGNARFLGKSDIASLEDRGIFPLSASAWLEADPGCALLASDTQAVIEKDSIWTGLQAFHAMVIEKLIDDLQQETARERSRLERREKSDDVRLDYAVRLLASPLGRSDGIPASEEGEDDPWLLACHALGRALRIQFKPHPDRRRGSAIADPVSAIARASGVRVRTVALRGSWWRQDNGPLLGRRESDRLPVALIPNPSGGYRLWDPLARTSSAVHGELAASLEPFAWSFYRPFPPKKLSALDLIRFGLDGCRRELVTIAIVGIAAGLLGMVTPIMTGIIFDSVIPGSNRALLLQIFLLLLVVVFCVSLFQMVQSFTMLRLEGRMDSAVQAAVWDRLLSLPAPFFRNYSAGDLAARSLSVSWMRQILTGSVLSSLFAGIFSVFSFALLFYYSSKLALLATALTLISLAATTLAGYLEVRYQRELMKIKGRLSGMLFQFINGISKLRVSGTERRAFSSWAREFTSQKVFSIRARKVTLALAVFTSAFPVLSSLAIFYAMAVVVNQQAAQPLSTGEFLAFNAAFTQFQVALLTLGTALVSMLGVVPLYERAQPILEGLPEVDRAKGYPGELSGKIEITHVSFRYRPDTPLVLKDVSLNIPTGSFVAIVGASGSGKSTLFRLLLGFETPESGSIYFDNQDLSHLDIQAVRRQIGVVLQSGRLLGGSIYQNIVGSAPLTIDEAWAAARMAGLEADIRAMPMGLHTVIAEGGGGLSGGQRQRLMIARAIVKRPRILLFDEATSALDNETQAIVSRSLESLQASRVVIAHRLSTIANADYIYVMDKGVVVEEGTYKKLMQNDGPFAALARRQMV